MIVVSWVASWSSTLGFLIGSRSLWLTRDLWFRIFLCPSDCHVSPYSYFLKCEIFKTNSANWINTAQVGTQLQHSAISYLSHTFQSRAFSCVSSLVCVGQRHIPEAVTYLVQCFFYYHLEPELWFFHLFLTTEGGRCLDSTQQRDGTLISLSMLLRLGELPNHAALQQ